MIISGYFVRWSIKIDLDDGDDVSADASIIVDIDRFIHSIVSHRWILFCDKNTTTRVDIYNRITDNDDEHDDENSIS